MNLERLFYILLEERKSVCDAGTFSTSMSKDIYLLRVEEDSSCVRCPQYSLDIAIRHPDSQGWERNTQLLLLVILFLLVSDAEERTYCTY
jgi:hypothetical protein